MQHAVVCSRQAPARVSKLLGRRRYGQVPRIPQTKYSNSSRVNLQPDIQWIKPRTASRQLRRKTRNWNLTRHGGSSVSLVHSHPHKLHHHLSRARIPCKYRRRKLQIMKVILGTVGTKHEVYGQEDTRTCWIANALLVGPVCVSSTR